MITHKGQTLQGRVNNCLTLKRDAENFRLCRRVGLGRENMIGILMNSG
jgi:hypothetical protein